MKSQSCDVSLSAVQQPGAVDMVGLVPGPSLGHPLTKGGNYLPTLTRAGSLSSVLPFPKYDLCSRSPTEQSTGHSPFLGRSQGSV